MSSVKMICQVNTKVYDQLEPIHCLSLCHVQVISFTYN